MEEKVKFANPEDLLKINMPVKDLLKMDDTVLEGFYKTGYHYNRAGDIARAKRYFRLLCLLDPLNPKYSLALGSALHKEKNYQEAAMIYLMTAIHDPKNPVPWFYLYDCYHNLKLVEEAYATLLVVVSLAGDDPNFVSMKKSAETLMQNEEFSEIKKEEESYKGG